MFCFRFIFLSIFSWANFCRFLPPQPPLNHLPRPWWNFSTNESLASWNRVSHADASSAGMDRQPITKVRRPGWRIFFSKKMLAGRRFCPPKQVGWYENSLDHIFLYNPYRNIYIYDIYICILIWIPKIVFCFSLANRLVAGYDPVTQSVQE